jgi:hypothetical protein
LGLFDRTSLFKSFMTRYFARVVQVFVLVGLAFSARAQSLVAHGDLWWYRKGTSDPAAGWRTAAEASLDGSWLSGPGGFGYADNTTERALVGTLLSDMNGSYSTVAMRKSFEIPGPIDPTLHLSLTVDFDDGFIAWLDGVYITSVNSPGAPNDPVFTATASASHESSRGDASASPASTYDLGAVGTRLGVGAHVLSIVGLNSSKSGSSDFIQIVDLELKPAAVGCESGFISENTAWLKGESPIVVCGNIVITAGATLTIEPGAVVQFQAGLGITVADGGTLIAEGDEANRIRFTGVTAATRWGGMVVQGSANSPETRIAYADFEQNGTTAIHSTAGTVFLDHIVFRATDEAYVSLDDSSFVVSHCHFPKPTGDFEPAHGTGGIKSGGHGIFRRNYFGGTVGYNDIVDFTGGQRGGPIVHFINNVVASSDDDGFDLDGTDAWVEGNIFTHVHRNRDTPDSAAAISGGSNSTNTSEVTIVGNLFFDCDNATTAKQTNFYILINNTIVHTTKFGGIDGGSGAINVRDTTPTPATTFARGQYLEGNIIWDAEQLVRNYDPAQTTVTLNGNLLYTAWSGPGETNMIADPLLRNIPSTNEVAFTNWQSAQILREWFALEAGSPAIGTGPDGADKGGVVPVGVRISGAPIGTTSETSATIKVGLARSGFGIPASSWPNGGGYTHYKWRIDDGAWSAETPIATPITLTALSNGAHYIEAVGKRDSGLYQDDPLFGEDAVISRSATWTVSAADALMFSGITWTDSQVSLIFQAAAGSSYTLLAKDSLDPSVSWSKVTNVPTQTVSGPVTINDQTSGASRFYQVVTPAQP